MRLACFLFPDEFLFILISCTGTCVYTSVLGRLLLVVVLCIDLVVQLFLLRKINMDPIFKFILSHNSYITAFFNASLSNANSDLTVENVATRSTGSTSMALSRPPNFPRKVLCHTAKARASPAAT